MAVVGIDHVQIVMPPGSIDRARQFWTKVMGLEELPRPKDLLNREGAWFTSGSQQIHIGVETEFVAARKAHVALRLTDFDTLIERLKAAGHPIVASEEDIPGFSHRIFSADPFGNRLELVQLEVLGPTPPPLASLAAAQSPASVLLLGDPRLRQKCAEVIDFSHADFKRDCDVLAKTLSSFREAHGFGRAISAPQIGIIRRFIAVNLGKGVFFVVNPIITHRSAEMFTMWDDCMSFPDLMVKHFFSSIKCCSYVDHEGKPRTWENMDLPSAELLQHEIDHLDGVLATDTVRTEDRNWIVMKSVYNKHKDLFRKQVDYVIQT